MSQKKKDTYYNKNLLDAQNEFEEKKHNRKQEIQKSDDSFTHPPDKKTRLNHQIVISDFQKMKNIHRDRKAIKFLGIIITEIFRKLKKIIRRHSTGKTDNFPVARQAIIILLDLQFLKIKSVKCRLVQRHRLRLGLKLQG